MQVTPKLRNISVVLRVVLHEFTVNANEFMILQILGCHQNFLKNLDVGVEWKRRLAGLLTGPIADRITAATTASDSS